MKPLGVVLRESVEIRKRADCCYLLDRARATLLLLHPSEALTLALMDGQSAAEDIEGFLRVVYRCPAETARNLLSSVLKNAAPFLTQSSAVEATAVRFNPRDYLFRCGPAEQRYTVPLDAPLVLNIVLGRACNFRCSYCFHGTAGQPNARLSRARVLRLVDEAVDLRMAIVGLSGGEPFLYPGFESIVEAIVGAGSVPLISTNGSLVTPSVARRLAHAGLKFLQVSLDAPEPELHHSLTGSRSSFDSVVAGIRSLLDNGIRVRIKSVITPENLHVVDPLIDFLRTLRVNEIIIAPQGHGSCEAEKQSVRDEGLTREQRDRLGQLVADRANEEGACPVLFSDAMRPWTSPNHIIQCANLLSSMVVLSTGFVSLCEMISDDAGFLIGSIHGSTVKDLWLNERHRQILALSTDPIRVGRECASCSQLSFCRSGCFNLSKSVAGDYFAQDPRCAGAGKMALENA